MESPVARDHLYGTQHILTLILVALGVDVFVWLVGGRMRKSGMMVVRIMGRVVWLVGLVGFGVVVVGLVMFGTRMFYAPPMEETWTMGMVSEDAAKIWFMSHRDITIYLKYYSTHNKTIQETPKHSLNPDNNRITVIPLNNLTPNTQYQWEALLDDGSSFNNYNASFKTFPMKNSPVSFSFHFGSCIEQSFWLELKVLKIWENLKPAFVLFLGDTIYTDLFGDIPPEQGYRQIFSEKNFISLIQKVPNFFIYDDHEIFNDYDQGKDKHFYQYAVSMWDLFLGSKNPISYPNPEKYHFYNFEYGNIGLFVLDTRMFRSSNHNPDTADKTMLGQAQKEKLFQWLLSNKSSKIFKFIASSVPWSAKIHFLDGWRSFLRERESIIDFIVEHDIPGVVLLSADIHYPLLSNISGPWLKEYSVSPIQSIPLFPWKEKDIPPQYSDYFKGKYVDDELLFVTDVMESGYCYYYGTIDIETTETDGKYKFSLMAFNNWGEPVEIWSIQQTLQDTVPTRSYKSLTELPPPLSSETQKLPVEKDET